MRWSSAHIPTLRDAPQEAEVISHKLMMRAALMRRLASGIYSWLPAGMRVIRKLENIIRDEMNRAGAQEVQLPIVQPRELWEEAGRWQIYGKELGRFKDRHEHDFCLQPTSEEAITDMVRKDVKSYRQLPINLYQIQTKFRDEIRPRFGVMRGREFIMKDAYSFDLTKEEAFQSYEVMRQAYRRIFKRSGLKFIAVDADTGTIGGTKSEEFTVLADSGEDEIVSCATCDYGANQEKAEGDPIPAAASQATSSSAYEKFATPGLKTIDDLAKSLKTTSDQLVKTMIATDSEGRIIVVLLRGDHELHEVKLQRVLNQEKGFKFVRLATDEELRSWSLPKGSLGPVAFPKSATVVIDSAIDMNRSTVVGANEEGFHFKNVVLSRDLKAEKVSGTLRFVRKGETCLKCKKPLDIVRGIEVGHVFYLGKKYSDAMKLEILNAEGKLQSVEMGCYGIGVGRTVAACIEQNNDQFGIVWPLALAPYELAVISLGEGAPKEAAKKAYESFLQAGIDVIWDDRDLSPGVKLKDADLVGIPFQMIYGEKGLKNQQVEWKVRKGNQKEFLELETAVAKTIDRIKQEREIRP